MKALVLVVLLAVGGWWYFIGGRTLSEADVHAFYQRQEAATLGRQPEALCALLAEGFEANGTVAMGGGSRTVGPQTKAQVCAGYRDLYAAWETLGEKMGGTLQLDSAYQVSEVVVAADRKSATAKVVSSLDVAGSVMNIRSRSNDTLIKRNGRVLLLRSEGVGSVSGG